MALHHGMAWSESRGTQGLAMDGEDWYDVRHKRLMITPDGTVKEEVGWQHCLNV